MGTKDSSENPNRIKSIDTEYNGYRFRSRTEARWAVFFDTVGIEWLYEMEGFEFDDGERYLPDFYLPEVSHRSTEKSGMWVEIKGLEPDCKWDEGVFETLSKLAGETSEPVALLSGEIRNYGHHEVDPVYYVDNYMQFVMCEDCGAIKFEFLEGNYMSCETCGGYCDREHWRLQEGIESARSARFEYGEAPGTTR